MLVWFGLANREYSSLSTALSLGLWVPMVACLYADGLQINMSMLCRFLYVMGCQIRYLRSMKGSMNLIRTRKHIKLKVLLLKFGVHHQLKPIQIGTLLSSVHLLTFCTTLPSCLTGTQLLLVLKWLLFPFYFPMFLCSYYLLILVSKCLVLHFNKYKSCHQV